MPNFGHILAPASLASDAEYAERKTLLARARAGHRDAIKTLADRYHVRIGRVEPVPSRTAPGPTAAQEGTMGDKATCDVCGETVKARGLAVHKARKHGNGSTTRTPNAILQDLDTAAITHNRARVEPAADCAYCPLRGNHAEQDLFVQLVRGGLSLADTVARMRQARAVYATTERR